MNDFSNLVCEQRNNSFDDSHEKEDLERQLELRSDICRVVDLFLFSRVFVNRLIVSIVSVAVDGVLVHVQGEVAVDTAEEYRVDESRRWAIFTAILHLVWSAHYR